jgi:hypothetical protein
MHPISSNPSPSSPREEPQADSSKHTPLSCLVKELETKIQTRLKSHSVSMASILNTAQKIATLQQEIPSLNKEDLESLRQSKTQLEEIISNPLKAKKFSSIKSTIWNGLLSGSFKSSSQKAEDVLCALNTYLENNASTQESLPPPPKAKKVTFGKDSFQEHKANPILSEIPTGIEPKKSHLKLSPQEKYRAIQLLAEQIKNKCTNIIISYPGENIRFPSLIKDLDTFSKKVKDSSHLNLESLLSSFELIKNSMETGPLPSNPPNKDILSFQATSLKHEVKEFTRLIKSQEKKKLTKKTEKLSYSNRLSKLAEFKQKLTVLWALSNNAIGAGYTREEILLQEHSVNVLIATTIHLVLQEQIK